LTWEPLLAQLTLESFPAVGLDVLSVLAAPLGVKPLSEALKMDVAHGTCTLARRNERIFFLILLAEADPTDFPIQGKLCPLSELKLE
jgi:hypothetical protein